MTMKRILVTGGAGLLGTYVRSALSEAHYMPISYDLIDTQDGAESFLGSIADLNALAAACNGIDTIIHIAAAANINDGTAQQILEINAMGSWNILEAANNSAVRRVVLCSSDSVMGNTVWPQHFWKPDSLPVAESHALRPTDPYGLSKLLAEETGRSFSARGTLEVLSLRPVFILFPSMIGEVKARNADPSGYKAGSAGGHVGAGGGLCWHHIDPRDVADAFVRSIDSSWNGFESYYLSADETLHPDPTTKILKNHFGGLPDHIDTDIYAAWPFAPMFSTAKARTQLGWASRFNHRPDIIPAVPRS